MTIASPSAAYRSTAKPGASVTPLLRARSATSPDKELLDLIRKARKYEVLIQSAADVADDPARDKGSATEKVIALINGQSELWRRIISMPARTAEGVIAKLILASPYVDAKNFDDDMADDILASAAIDARALQAAIRDD
jgi:hypothetical protein